MSAMRKQWWPHALPAVHLGLLVGQWRVGVLGGASKVGSQQRQMRPSQHFAPSMPCAWQGLCHASTGRAGNEAGATYVLRPANMVETAANAASEGARPRHAAGLRL